MIYPTEFEWNLTAKELGYVRKGLQLLYCEIKKKPGGWKDNGDTALNCIKHILRETKDLL